MIDVKKIIICLFVIESSYVYSEESITDEDVTDEDLQEIDDNNDNKDIENTNNNKVKRNNNNAVGGWYSGLDVKYVPSKLNAQETKPDNSTENYSIKNDLISPSMILGYDFLLNKLLLGGECNISFNFGSPIDYKDKVHNQDIAKIKKGINVVGAIKIGVALGSWIVYGKIGGDLSKWKYDWKQDNKNDTEKKYKASLLYGGGIEKQFLNNCYVRTEFSYSPSITHSDTRKNVKDCKMSEVKTTNYQISIGGGYRF